MPESLPSIQQTLYGGSLSNGLIPSNTPKSDTSAQFLNVLKQQLLATQTGTNANAPSGVSRGADETSSNPTVTASAQPPEASLTPALAEMLVASIMQQLPVPGMDDGSTNASTSSLAAWNPSSSSASDAALSTYALLQTMQGSQSSFGGTASNLMSTVDATSFSGVPVNLTNLGPNVENAVNAAASKYGVAKKLILAVIHQESGMDPTALSSTGAQGLMQLMPETARTLGVTNAFDPVQNVDAGTHYLANMLNQFGSVPLALAAYNAGPGAVQAYGGIPPYAETQNYVKSVMATAAL